MINAVLCSYVKKNAVLCSYVNKKMINLGDFISNLALFGPLMTPHLDMKGSSLPCFLSIYYTNLIFS